tara:strand:+ start:4500 stop:4742 length:243 start_codon:yes stop_codon:yes gene_type:complete
MRFVSLVVNAIPHAVILVLTSSAVSQIAQVVVHRVIVRVEHFHTFGARAYKCTQHKPVNLVLPRLMTIRKFELPTTACID